MFLCHMSVDTPYYIHRFITIVYSAEWRILLLCIFHGQALPRVSLSVEVHSNSLALGSLKICAASRLLIYASVASA